MPESIHLHEVGAGFRGFLYFSRDPVLYRQNNLLRGYCNPFACEPRVMQLRNKVIAELVSISFPLCDTRAVVPVNDLPPRESLVSCHICLRQLKKNSSCNSCNYTPQHGNVVMETFCKKFKLKFNYFVAEFVPISQC